MFVYHVGSFSFLCENLRSAAANRRALLGDFVSITRKTVIVVVVVVVVVVGFSSSKYVSK